jgi:hypothetical protein
LINIGETRGSINIKQIPCRHNCPSEEEEQPEEDGFRYWSKAADWEADNIPQEGDTVEVKAGWKMIVDIDNIPTLTKLKINGSLIFKDSININAYSLNAKIIHVTNLGKLLVGEAGTPFTKKLSINIHGGQQDDMIVLSPTVTPSNKVLLVAGLVEIYGNPPSVN